MISSAFCSLAVIAPIFHFPNHLSLAFISSIVSMCMPSLILIYTLNCFLFTNFYVPFFFRSIHIMLQILSLYFLWLPWELKEGLRHHHHLLQHLSLNGNTRCFSVLEKAFVEPKKCGELLWEKWPISLVSIYKDS